MSMAVLGTCLLIIFARIADVSLGTLRTVSVVNGRRTLSFWIGFVEVLIWVFAVSQVINNLSEPLYAICYAGGFALGTYLGIVVEDSIALGHQVVRIFTRRGDAMADCLREAGYIVTVLDGRGKEGPIQILFIETKRKQTGALARLARSIDDACYYVVDDIRYRSTLTPMLQPATGWRAVMKRK